MGVLRAAHVFVGPFPLAGEGQDGGKLLRGACSPPILTFPHKPHKGEGTLERVMGTD